MGFRNMAWGLGFTYDVETARNVGPYGAWESMGTTNGLQRSSVEAIW